MFNNNIQNNPELTAMIDRHKERKYSLRKAVFILGGLLIAAAFSVPVLLVIFK